MTLDELAKELGLDTEENKEKFSVLKKEYNALSKAQKDLTKKVETLETEAATNKASLEKYDIITKYFDLDTEAEDFDKMLDDKKEQIVKDAGGGTPPEEVTRITRDLTKAQRDLASSQKTINELTEKLNTETAHRINGVKRDALHKALVANNVLKSDQFIDMFINKVEVDKDGTTVTMKDDAGNELSVADAIADWAKANPEFVQKNVLGGFGSGTGGTMGNNNEGLSDLMKSIIDERTQNTNPDGKSLSELFG